jgi:cytochrome c
MEMKNLTVFVLVLGVCAMYAVALAQQTPMTETNPKAELRKSIESGKALFGDSKLGATGQSCNDCHLAGGTKDATMGKLEVKAFNNLAAMYPKYFMMANKVVTLDQIVNWCIVTPMKGAALAWDDQRLADLVAYVVSVKPEMTKPETKPVKPAEKLQAEQPKK